MTNTKVLELHNVLSGLKGLKGIKFNYCISKNLAILETEIQSIQSTLKSSDNYKIFDEKRIELCKKYAKKDSNDQPVKIIDPETKQERYEIGDQLGFDTEYALLKEENKEIVTEREKQLSDFNEFLGKESTITLYKIKLEDVSEDITTEQMVGIYPLIEE